MHRETTFTLKDLSLTTLLQSVQIYERRIIDGSSTDADIDGYVQCQLELAERLSYRYSEIDPRD